MSCLVLGPRPGLRLGRADGTPRIPNDLTHHTVATRTGGNP
ncbi:hypothetical protein [Streptomyces sp. NPDC089915]